MFLTIFARFYVVGVCRARNWKEVWQASAQNNLLTMKKTQLADQDIINAVIKENPDMVAILPCYWNLQIKDHTRFSLT